MADYGHLIVDECHHLSARSFELVARRAKARFITGLSATVARKDGHHPIIFMQCGPVRHRVDAKAQAAQPALLLITCLCARRVSRGGFRSRSPRGISTVVWSLVER
jgi:superfamily II DNA or RNA helicase